MMRCHFLLLAAAVCGAAACETVLKHVEITTTRAVEFFGAMAGSQLGFIVSGAGDVNGDGFEDFALSAHSENSAGAVYVVFGRNAAKWASASFNFSLADTPDPASWIRISSATLNSNIGYYSLAHGDFNGDGLGDLLISSSTGKAFCVFGRNGTWSSFGIDELESGAVPGFVLVGGSSMSRYVCNAGDMNGDGIEDLLIPAYSSCVAYVIFGLPGSSRGAFNLSSVDGTNGFSLSDGTTNLGVGWAMGSAGDVNGDGLADLVIGSSFANNSGRTYVLFACNASLPGQQWAASLNFNVDLDGTSGFAIENKATNLFGLLAVGAGDVNADGFADIFIGSGSKGACVVFGHPTPWTSLLDGSLLNGTDGFRISDFGESWGYSGGGVGDFNSNGVDDIVIGGTGALDSNSVQTGAAAIIFGHGGAWPAELSRSDFVGSVGFLVDGPLLGSQFGWSARGAGDVNGDGHADFLVGARFGGKGYALLVFGVAYDHCAVCSNFTNECLACDDRFYLDPVSSLCEACFFNCRICTSSSDCITCIDNYFLSGSGTCKACDFRCRTCTSSSDCTDCEDGFVLVNGFCEEFASSSSSSASASSSAAVVVIEIGGGGGNASEVAAEIAQLLGVDVGQISVVEITPGTFEVTVINEEVTQQLVILVNQCIEEDSASGEL